MDALINELKKEIVEQLNLQVKPEDIKEHEPLFIEGLGLDSIDALELIVLLQKKYGIKINSAEEGKDIFYSLKTMADFIRSKQQK
jgi:acyl carrier protein